MMDSLRRHVILVQRYRFLRTCGVKVKKRGRFLVIEGGQRPVSNLRAYAKRRLGHRIISRSQQSAPAAARPLLLYPFV